MSELKPCHICGAELKITGRKIGTRLFMIPTAAATLTTLFAIVGSSIPAAATITLNLSPHSTAAPSPKTSR